MIREGLKKKLKAARQRISIIDEWEGGRSWYIIGGAILALNDLIGCLKKFQKKVVNEKLPLLLQPDIPCVRGENDSLVETKKKALSYWFTKEDYNSENNNLTIVLIG